jgi:hypothetical protein
MAGQGRPKTGGRQKGTLNKASALLKDAVLEAADIAGGKAGLVGYLALQARKTPSPLWDCWANSYRLKSQQKSLKVLQR